MLRILTLIALMIGTSAAVAQSTQDHQQHHPGASTTQAQPAPASPSATAPPAQMMQGMPEKCRSMMQNMQSCMGTMQQMMHGRSGMNAPQQHGGTSTQTPSPATKAYLEAAERMHAPMMEGVQAGDPDIAFVRGMIPHHQAAIDMAKVVLQYGKDTQTRKLAEGVIREQQREINDMQAWLQKSAR